MANDNEQVSSIEKAIERYIAAHNLTDGSPLPPPRELAASLQCDERLVQEALASATRARRTTLDDGVWHVAPAPLLRDSAFSFSNSAKGRSLTTKVMDATVRPPTTNEDDVLFEAEGRAHVALGLTARAPFIFMERVRLFEGRPVALQRTYLNPGHFPKDFLARHDFEKESLIATYIHYGYTPQTRDTALEARLTSPYERSRMTDFYRKFDSTALLDAEQQLYAVAAGQRPFLLEFMKASYFNDLSLGNWRYEIKNRPASAD